MKRTLLLAILLLSVGFSKANPITLEECRKAAHDNYPSIKQYDLIEKSKKLDVSNASKAWIPGVKVAGFGVGFTDLLNTELIDAMGIGHENGIYGGALIVTQTVYDGGAIKAQKGIIKAQSEVETRQMDVAFNELDGRIEEIYFGILTLDEELRQLCIHQDNLAIAEKSVKSLMTGGLANQTDLDIINVNQVNTAQEEIKLRDMRKTYTLLLSYFCPTIAELQSPNVELKIPDSISSDGDTESYTLSMFEAKESVLDAQKKNLNSKITPTVGAFALGAAHNKMISPMYNTNFIGGGVLIWNIGAFYTRKNDLFKLDNNRDKIGVQRETFLFEKKLNQQTSKNRIESIKDQMKLDDRTITLRENILEKSKKKVSNGTETVNEMLRNINELSSARLQKSLHEIELLKESYKLDNINRK